MDEQCNWHPNQKGNIDNEQQRESSIAGKTYVCPGLRKKIEEEEARKKELGLRCLYRAPVCGAWGGNDYRDMSEYNDKAAKEYVTPILRAMIEEERAPQEKDCGSSDLYRAQVSGAWGGNDDRDLSEHNDKAKAYVPPSHRTKMEEERAPQEKERGSNDLYRAQGSDAWGGNEYDRDPFEQKDKAAKKYAPENSIVLSGLSCEVNHQMIKIVVSRFFMGESRTNLRDGTALIDCLHKHSALMLRIAIGKNLLLCCDLLQSPDLRVRLKSAPRWCSNDLGLILRQLPNSISVEWVTKVLEYAHARISEDIMVSQDSASGESKRAVVHYKTSQDSLTANQKLEAIASDIMMGAVGIECPKICIELVRVEETFMRKDPAELLRSFKATPCIQKLFDRMNICQQQDKQFPQYGFLQGGTGTGKTIGLAVYSVLQGKSIIVVVPKVVQVNMLYDFLNTITFPLIRNGKTQPVRIGFSAGREVKYSFDDDYDVVIVTYGHFFRKILRLMKQHGSQTVTLQDYLIVLDEVHESNGHIQAVLSLSTRITNQKVIISATMDRTLLQTIIGPACYSDSIQEIIVDKSMHEVKIEYKSIEYARSSWDLVNIVCEITKAELSKCTEFEKILVFVPGFKYIDKIRSTLASQNIVSKHDSGAAYSDRWSDEILEVVENRRVIIATSVLESSVTIKGLKVVIDTVLKNELVDDISLEEVRLSRAEAEQRAGRVGRHAPGRVIRLISEREFRQLRDYPHAPFDLGCPFEIFLSMAEVFSFEMHECWRDERIRSNTPATCTIGEILQLNYQQCTSCIYELKSLKLLNKDSVTSFGSRVLSLGMSLKFACVIQKVFDESVRFSATDGSGNSISDSDKMFVLVLAVAFDNFESFVFDLPLEIRVSRFEERLKYVNTDQYGGNHFIGYSSIETLVKIVIEAIYGPGNIEQNVIKTENLRNWCATRRVNSRYLHSVLKQLSIMAPDLFKKKTSTLKNLPGMIANSSHCTGLKDLFANPRKSAKTQAEIHSMISRNVCHFGEFFLKRFFRGQNEKNDCPTYIQILD
jgi:hypothetical protein